jgi:CheY-like chemotaxis protein
LFPVALAVARSATEREARPLTARPQPAALSGTVLVADDEVQVRSVTELLLKRMGLRVLSADDGERAVELFRQHAADIRFVLVDLTMPKLDGLKALAEIRRIRPDVKVVLMSGYDSNDLVQRFENEGFDGFIQKPCDVESFKQIVQQMCI